MIHIASFYRFVPLPDTAELQQRLRSAAETHSLLGTLLLADEGMNGSLAGELEDLQGFFIWLAEDPRFQGLKPFFATAESSPFLRLKIRLKEEIVSLGQPVDAAANAGEYVAPEDWDALIRRPEVRLVDTRNRYEYALGSFQGAEDPGTEAFRDFPAWVDASLDPDKDTHVAMFCTGGIRCEKATALLREKGFHHVYHLEGGILNYLQQIPEEQQSWRGECFVFDDRISVHPDLRPGEREICPGCRRPLDQVDRSSPHFVEGVACPECYDRLTPERRARLSERHRQIRLARARGERHLGPQD